MRKMTAALSIALAVMIGYTYGEHHSGPITATTTTAQTTGE